MFWVKENKFCWRTWRESIVSCFFLCSKKKYQGLYRQFCDQVDTLSKQIVQHHGYLLSTVLLHDAESHDLQSNKEFYEVEHSTASGSINIFMSSALFCSHFIVCSLYLSGWKMLVLHSDVAFALEVIAVWPVADVPSQSIAIHPCCGSVRVSDDADTEIHKVWRHCQEDETVQVSHRKLQQAKLRICWSGQAISWIWISPVAKKWSLQLLFLHRCDISAILAIVSDVLYPCCANIQTYLDVTINTQPQYAIHNMCSTLLAAMAVIAAPIETVYKCVFGSFRLCWSFPWWSFGQARCFEGALFFLRVYKKGFFRKRHKGDENSRGYASQWLSWIRPALFPHRKLWLVQAD